MSRKMKDSGIEWIGEIPEDWEVSRIKNYLKRNEPRNPGDKIVLSLYRDLGIVPKDSRDDNHNVTSLDTSNYKYVCIGDFVINKMKAWQGSVAVSDYEGIVSPAYYVYNFTDSTFVKKYFHYLLRNCYKDEFRRLSGGIREGQWDLSSENFDTTLVIIPDKISQTAIAAYLDRQCTHIDNIIEKTKTSIEEYKKLKQAVITQAVTKGIRGNREMKDSGIEWIGEIPVEWEITRIKNYCKLITGGTPSTNNQLWFNGDIEWFTPGDFLDNYWLENSKRKLSQKALEEQVAVYVKKGTVLIVGIGATAGKVGITAKDSSFNQQITALVSESINSKYLLYWLEINKGFIRETANYTTLPIINNQTLGQYVLIIPRNKDEQQEIAAYLDQKCSEIDAIITKKQQFITEMENYKKSLIFECVTGKREVSV